MSLFQRAMQWAGWERRASPDSAPADPYWFNFAASHGGQVVTARRAESVSAVYACVSAISETIASLPLILYRRDGEDGRERATDHPLYRVLHDTPNERQTALEFREQLQASVLLRGNGYAEIGFGSDGRVRSLTPIHPDRVNVLELENARLGYDVQDSRGRTRRLTQDEVLHLRHRTEHGSIGVSPITAAREVVALTLQEREHGLATFRNATRLSGVIEHPGHFKTKDDAQTFVKAWQDLYGGASLAGRTAVLEHGMKFSPISMSLEDAEWIAARQFSVEEVCRLFRVPPVMVGDLRHANYSNSVEMNRIFVTHTLRRHLTMWEQAIGRALLTEASRRVYFAEHSVEGLLRGDASNRAQFYHFGIDDGWLEVDEVRRFENLPRRINRPEPEQ